MAPGKQKKSKRFSCDLCTNINNARMIQCDRCEAKFHMKCVNVQSLDDDNPWICAECLKRDASRQSKSDDKGKLNPSNRPQHSSNSNNQTAVENSTNDRNNHHPGIQSIRESEPQRSEKSHSVSSSIKRGTQLELERLEEERRLTERRDKDYLDSKYRILQSDRHSSKSRSNVSENCSVDRSSLTQEWVRNQSLENQPPSASRNSLIEEHIDDPETREQIREFSRRIEELTFDNTSPLNSTERLITMAYQLGIAQGHTESKSTAMVRIPQANPLSSDNNSKTTKGQVNCQQIRKSCPVHDAKLHMFQDVDGQKGPISNSTFAVPPRFEKTRKSQSMNTDLVNNETLEWDDYIGTQHNIGKYPIPRSTSSTVKRVASDNLDTTKFRSNGQSDQRQAPMKSVVENPFEWKSSSQNTQSMRADGQSTRGRSNPRDRNFNETYVSTANASPRSETRHGNFYDNEDQSNRQYDNNRCSGSSQSNRKVEFHDSTSYPNHAKVFAVDAEDDDYDYDEYVASYATNPGLSIEMRAGQIAARHVVDKKLPNFSGNPKEWLVWYCQYKNSTKLCGFSNGENLDRLQRCLKDEAKTAVKGYLMHPKLVPDIIDTLKTLFGRPELIIKATINEVRNYPPVKPDRLDQLMDFAFEIQSMCTTIESLNRTNHLNDPLLIDDLVEKLPTQEKKEWARFRAGKENVTVKTLSLWLYDLAKLLSTVTSPQSPKSNKSNNKSSEKEKFEKNEKVAGLEHVNVHVEERDGGNKNQRKKFPCLVCNGVCNKLETCSKFQSFSVDNKWKAVKEHKLCRICLRKHKDYCRVTTLCGKNGCQYRHHSLLHNDERHSTQKPTKNTTVAPVNLHTATHSSTLVRIVPVILYNGIKLVYTFAFLDDGSTVTMMERRIADKLGLDGTSEQICLIWTKNIHRQERAKRVSLKISGRAESSKLYALKGVRTVDELHLPTQSINKTELVARYPYLKDVPFIDYENATAGILIGSDMPKFGAQLEIVESSQIESDEFSGPMATRTRIGWTVHGPRQLSSPKEYANVHQWEVCPHHNDLDNDIHQKVKEYFSMENFGVQSNSTVSLQSKEDEKALEMLNRLTKKVNGRYETGLLWKNDKAALPDSYPMALKRLKSLENQGPEVIRSIGEKVADYVAKGYAQKLSQKELKYDGPVWYLPLFGVTHPKKPEKLRMVFDAAAKVKSVSLNSKLMKGPDLYTSLIDILRRFRERRYTGGGDIAEMYHQVAILERDQHFQRFIFRDDKTKEPEVYAMKRMTFGANCSPASAQFIKNKNAKKFVKTHPRAVSAIIDNHYVDDMMESEHSEEEMIQLMKDVKMIHTEAGFNMRNFISNSETVLDALGECERKDAKSIAVKSELKTERVLGMWYDTKTDTFTFSLKYTLIDANILSGTKLPTKREILRTLMSLFDPLGLLSNFLIQLKILLQEVWKSKIDWDEQLSSKNLIERWKQWLNVLPEVEKVRVPRLYSSKMSPNTPKSTQMHVFVDASGDAFAALVYLRIEDDDGANIAFVGSKARVAPLKYLSIPRLELLASVLGTRLSESIRLAQRFKIDRRIIWTDSATVISWLNSDHRKYSQFVAHRVGEILENSDVHEWRWIPTNENVADEATKWKKIPDFKPTNRWFRGPEFLRFEEDKWPKKKSVPNDVEEEMRAHFAHSSFLIPQIVQPERFSKYKRMIRAVAYAVRFRNYFNGKIKKGEPLRQEELSRAENLVFRQAQFEGYPAEMVTLERNKVLPLHRQKLIEKPSPLHAGTPYIDAEGIIRLKQRIDGARDLSMDTKRPIVLPRESRITTLVLLDYHYRFCHQNDETVVNEVRQKFYIPSLRVAIKKAKRSCQHCKIKKAHPNPPQMADLPASRLATRFRPYSFVGIDFFGPIYVTVGRNRREKRWGVLFTCLTIRAIHIEIASGLDTNSCILCINNFIADHGPVIEFHSDCGTNFKGADNALQEELDKIDPERLLTEFTTPYTKWIFNPPASPHMGGSWERMIQSVKSAMDEIMPTRTPREDMLRNVFKQVQNVVNSRPLTYIPLDFDEDEALTPNHFLKLSSSGSKPPCEININGRYLRESWKEAQRLTEIFWKRFVKEYLPAIARRTKWHKPVTPLKPGDLVLIIDENSQRNTYPKARVIETEIGSNDQVRRAKVHFISGTRSDVKGKITEVKKSGLWRPAHKLALLDVVASKNSLAQLDRETGGSVDATDSNDIESNAVPLRSKIKHESTTIDSADASSAHAMLR